MGFPPLKSGDRITRAWFNRLIDYCNSLSLSGDGRTTRVSHGSAGTVVSAIPQAVEGVGARPLPPFHVSISGGTVAVEEGHIVLTGEAGGGRVEKIDRATFRAQSLGSLYLVFPTLTPPSSGHAIAWHRYVWATSGYSVPGLAALPIAYVSRSSGVYMVEQYQRGTADIDVPSPMPFETYCLFDGTGIPASGASLGGSVLSGFPFSSLVVAGGYAPTVTPYSSTPPHDTWHSVADAAFAASEFSGMSGQYGYIAIVLSSGGSSYVVRTTSTTQLANLYAYDDGTAGIPIVVFKFTITGGSVYVNSLQQAVLGAQYAIPLVEISS